MTQKYSICICTNVVLEQLHNGPKILMKSHSHTAIVVRPLGGKTLCRSLVICKGFFQPATPAVIWRVFQFCKEIWFGLWSCYLRMAFLDGDNFCKAFAGALVNMSYHLWLHHSWYDKFTCAPAKAAQKLSPSRKTTYNSILKEIFLTPLCLLLIWDHCTLLASTQNPYDFTQETTYHVDYT